ncbi:MAG: hypothetical protein KDF49_09395 [Nitrosomonas sp.]|nr:hypothetical protein [Nitrosomonas sp.]
MCYRLIPRQSKGDYQTGARKMVSMINDHPFFGMNMITDETVIDVLER